MASVAIRRPEEPVSETPAEGARGEEEKKVEHRQREMEARRKALVQRGEAHEEQPSPAYEEKRK